MGAADQGTGGPDNRWQIIPRTLAFVCNGDAVLLQRRREDSRIYPGRYNGLGGHLERDEDPLGGIRRELLEEAGLEVSRLRLRALYNIDPGGARGVMLFVFTCVSAGRQLAPQKAEGELRWVRRADLLSLPLVEDLPSMLPLYLDMADDAAPLFVHVSYDYNDNHVLRIAPDDGSTGQEP